MGDFEYGIFVVVWVGAVILGGLACLGFQTAILRFVPEYFERGEEPLLRGVLLGSRIQGFVAATVLRRRSAPLGLYFFGDSLSSYYLIPLYLGADHPADAGDRRDPGRHVARLQLGRPRACGRPSSSGRC